MRFSMFHLMAGGTFLGIIGFVLALIGLIVRAWMKRRRPETERRWRAIPLIFSVPGEVLEFVGLFLILISVATTITQRNRIFIESQFLLTLALVILPLLIAAVVVRGFNYLMHKLLIRRRPAAPAENLNTEDRREVVNNLIDRI